MTREIKIGNYFFAVDVIRYSMFDLKKVAAGEIFDHLAVVL